jgi:FkbM family methyltransferase
MMVSKIATYFNKQGFRWVSAIIIFVVYRIKGQNIRRVAFNAVLGLWEYTIGKAFFLTKDPAWFSSRQYYLDVFKTYAGYFYQPRPGDTVIDIGAGVGEEVFPVSELVGREGKIHAIEANPNTFAVLKYYCTNNGFNNTVLHNLAITAQSGTIFIEDDGEYGVQNAISLQKTDKMMEVSAMSLDDFVELNKIETVDLLKVNIEGAEQFVIKGMNRSVNRIKHVAISCHDFRHAAGESDFFKTYDEVMDYIQQHFAVSFQQTGDAVRDNYIYGVNKNLA